MNPRQHTLTLHLLLIIGLLLPITSFSSVGKAKMVLGKVMLVTEQGQQQRLRRGSTVNVGDTIVTSKRGQAQLTMIDGTKISVRPASKFQIEEFIATGKAENQKTYYKLLKGGFRSVTGKIGKRNKSSFRLSTPVATMGIRGTDFTGKYCANDCPASTGKNGLFVDVIDGGISITNKGGTLHFDKESNGYVANANVSPRVILELPDNLLSPKAKKKTRKHNKRNKKRRNKRKKYPSPEEETIQIGLYVDPENKDDILTEAMEAGVPPAEIMRGADSAGMEAKEFVPFLINKGKEFGMEPSDFVAPIFESGIDENFIGDMMSQNLESASDILMAAIATGEFNNEQLKISALNAGVNPLEVESAETVGNLFAIPPELKKILNDKEAKKDHRDGSKKKNGIQSRELNPISDSSDIASPS